MILIPKQPDSDKKKTIWYAKWNMHIRLLKMRLFTIWYTIEWINHFSLGGHHNANLISGWLSKATESVLTYLPKIKDSDTHLGFRVKDILIKKTKLKDYDLWFQKERYRKKK